MRWKSIGGLLQNLLPNNPTSADDEDSQRSNSIKFDWCRFMTTRDGFLEFQVWSSSCWLKFFYLHFQTFIALLKVLDPQSAFILVQTYGHFRILEWISRIQDFVTGTSKILDRRDVGVLDEAASHCRLPIWKRVGTISRMSSLLSRMLFEHMELSAKLLDHFLRSNQSNINQSMQKKTQVMHGPRSKSPLHFDIKNTYQILTEKTKSSA